MKTEYHSMSKVSTTSHYNSNALGSVIRILRENCQLTQAELGNLSSFSTAEISKLENGERKKVPIESLIRIAPHLNVSLDYLLLGCIDDYKSDRERFYDFNGHEIDLYQIAKNIYNIDSSLLLLLSSPDFLADKETISFFKEWLDFKSSIDNAPEENGILKKIFNEFKDYCFRFIQTLSHSSTTDPTAIKQDENCNKFTPLKGDTV